VKTTYGISLPLCFYLTLYKTILTEVARLLEIYLKWRLYHSHPPQKFTQSSVGDIDGKN